MVMLFEADACLVIKNGESFVRTVIDRYQSLYLCSHISFDRVKHIDSMSQLRGRKPITFREIRDFSYEKAYRFVSFEGGEQENPYSQRTIQVNPNDLKYDIIKIECIFVLNSCAGFNAARFNGFSERLKLNGKAYLISY